RPSAIADLDQETNTVAGLASGPPVTLMPASPSANSFTSSQLRLPYSRLFVVLMRTSRPRLAPGETVTPSTVRSSLTSMGVRTRWLDRRMNRSATVTFKCMFTVALPRASSVQRRTAHLPRGAVGTPARDEAGRAARQRGAD